MPINKQFALHNPRKAQKLKNPGTCGNESTSGFRKQEGWLEIGQKDLKSIKKMKKNNKKGKLGDIHKNQRVSRFLSANAGN